MFEFYGNTKSINNLTLKNFSNVFWSIFSENFQTKYDIWAGLRSKNEITLRKVRNVHGVRNAYYSIDRYLSTFKDVYWLFNSPFYPRHSKFLGVKGNDLWFLFDGRVWFTRSMDYKEFLKVFPKGIPQTEREMEQWIAYVGYMAHMDAKSRYNVGMGV